MKFMNSMITNTFHEIFAYINVIFIGMLVFERLLTNIIKYYQLLSNIIKYYQILSNIIKY